MRVYQGTLGKAKEVTNTRTGKRHKVGRLVRMHSNEMNDITEAQAGDIVALFGVDCSSGDTFTDGKVNITMTSMHVPDAVISLAVSPKEKDGQVNFSKALNRFTREDPTLRVHRDEGTVSNATASLHQRNVCPFSIVRRKKSMSSPAVANWGLNGMSTSLRMSRRNSTLPLRDSAQPSL